MRVKLFSTLYIRSFFLFVIFIATFNSQTIAQITFQKTYGGFADEDIGNLMVAPDSGYVVVGNTKSCTQTIADMCIFKTDKSGNLQWVKSYGDIGTGNVNIAAIENGYIIAGNVQVAGNGYDILVTRTDTGGNVLWKKTFGGSQDDYGNTIYRMKNGEYVVLGYTRNYGAGGWDAFAMRITGNGDVVWFKTYGTYATDLVNRLVEESDGSIVMTGATYISGIHNMMLLTTDSSGNLLWAKQYDYPGDQSGYGIARASNGDYVIVTGAYTDSTTDDILLYRTNAEGILRWARIYNNTSLAEKTYDAGFDVKVLSDGSIVVAGEWAGSTQETKCDGFLMKTDSIGSILWSKSYGGSETEYFRTLSLTEDGGFILGGKTNNSDSGKFDIVLIKTAANGMAGSIGTPISPDYNLVAIQATDVSLSSSAYSINGQSSQFSRNGSACWNSRPLLVDSVTPFRNALNIAQNCIITATFSSNINPSTLTNSTVKINGSLSGLHTSIFDYDSSSLTVSITPNTQFKVGELITVMLTPGIQSVSGDLLLRSSCWSFTVKTNACSGLFYPSSTVGVGNTPWYIAAADFDKDGAIDLAVINNYGNSVSILKNDGSGSFALASTIPVGSFPASITAADADGDGYMDLAVTNYGSATVSLLRNNGNGTFTRSDIQCNGIRPWDVAALDVDGDSDLDLALANFSSNSVSILKNDGNGAFIYSSSVSVGQNPYTLAILDLEGDGVMDLAVANYTSNSVSLLKNDGSGIFTQISTVNVGEGPVFVLPINIDGNNTADLVVSNNKDCTISILKNNGSGVFTLNSTDTLGTQRAFPAATDIDGDGSLDLVVPGIESISILKNNGAGMFVTNSVLNVSKESIIRMVVAADFNNDGQVDFAGVDQITNSISIFKASPKIASLRVSSSALSFGMINAGSSKSQYLKIYNDGTDSSLVISSIGSFNPVFVLNRTSLSIPASGSDSVQVTFSPTQSNLAFNDSIFLMTNDPEKPMVKISLSGTTSFAQPQEAVVIATVGGPIYAGLSILGDNVMYAVASGDAVYRMNTSGTIAYTLQVGGDVRSSSSIAHDTTVYIASSDRNLYAFSKDGNSVWSPLPTGGVLTATPVVDSIANRVYIGVSNYNFIAVNRSTGIVAWNYFADDQIKQSAVVTSDRKLVFVSDKGTLYGFNLNALTLSATPAWQIALSDTAPSPLAVDALGYIYVGTSAGNLIKILLPVDQPASIVWQTSIGSAITSSPVIDANGIIYVGSINSKLYAVNPQTGIIKWEFATKGPIRSTPTISDLGNIYVANDSGEVYAVDTSKNVLWKYQAAGAISAPLLHYKSHLYAGTLGHQIIRMYGKEESAGIAILTKLSLAAQTNGQPMWSTFQGNSQRTGVASASRTTGIKNTDNRTPCDYFLLQNYPNPFNPSTTIKYELPTDEKVSIKVFNMLGQQLLVPIDGFQLAGYHQVTFDTETLPSGIYFYQMTAGSFVQTKKMILMK